MVIPTIFVDMWPAYATVAIIIVGLMINLFWVKFIRPETEKRLVEYFVQDDPSKFGSTTPATRPGPTTISPQSSASSSSIWPRRLMLSDDSPDDIVLTLTVIPGGKRHQEDLGAVAAEIQAAWDRDTKDEET